MQFRLSSYGALAAVIALCVTGTLSPAAAEQARMLRSIDVRVGADRPGLLREVRSTAAMPPSKRLSLNIHLAYPNASAVHAFTDVVNNPRSPMWGKFLTPKQFTAAFAPSPATVAHVMAVLASEGLHVSNVSPNRKVLHVDGAARDIEAAFHPHLATVLFRGQKHFANLEQARLPASLQRLVMRISGLDDLPKYHNNILVKYPSGYRNLNHKFPFLPHSSPISGPRANPVPMPSLNPIPPTVASNLPFTGYGPQDIEAAYNYPEVGMASAPTGTGATISIEGAYGYSPADLDEYLAHYNVSRTASVLMETPDGPSPFNPYESIETDADIEQSAAQAPGATIELYEAPAPLNIMIEDMYDATVNDPNVDVVTTSFGSCETNDAGEEMGAADDLFTQGSAEGQTMFAAAGDDGAQDCRATEPTNSVDFPSSSPEVGSAGGTTMVDTKAGGPIMSESGWSCETTDAKCSNGAGGGGISAAFSLPPWQRGLPGAKSQQFFNRPDLSLNADVNTEYALVLDGQAALGVGGTSLVAPNLAALYAIIDGYYGHRMGRAEATIYRPFLTGVDPYAAGLFHDLTIGDNTDLAYEVKNAGFVAGPGYDNDNGWGSIDGTKFLLSIPKPTGSNNL